MVMFEISEIAFVCTYHSGCMAVLIVSMCWYGLGYVYEGVMAARSLRRRNNCKSVRSAVWSHHSSMFQYAHFSLSKHWLNKLYVLIVHFWNHTLWQFLGQWCDWHRDSSVLPKFWWIFGSIRIYFLLEVRIPIDVTRDHSSRNMLCCDNILVY